MNHQRVSLTLLDSFRLRQDGRDVPLQPCAQRLLAFLAIQDRPVRRAYVSGCLWPDTSQDQANANLRTTLWRLRRLASQPIRVSATEVSLADGIEVDVRELVARARRVLADRSDPSDLEELASAGELLPELADGWAVVERELIHQLRLHALERLCAQLSDAGSYTDAARAGMAAVAVEPLRESAHRALIRTRLAEGKAAEATRQYRLFCALARDRLRIPPSARLHALMVSRGEGVR